MKRIVVKFGGTSVANIDRIKNVAKIIKEHNDGNVSVCVVVSAMSGTTNSLIEHTKDFPLTKVSHNQSASEYDVIVSAGEQISAGLLALSLQDLGLNARSWLGWQAGINTTGAHTKATIDNIDASKLINSLDEGNIAIVAGFQGVDKFTSKITTLGRGGSDTSAVALAVGIGAFACYIYTDVEGVFTCDPRIVKTAKKIDKICYEEMLELASLGSKVLQTRSVGIAMKYNMPIKVLSSFNPSDGTTIQSEDAQMEKQTVIGIAAAKDEAQITISGVPDNPGIVLNIFKPLGMNKINVDMIIQTTSRNGKTANVTFTVPASDMIEAVRILEENKQKIGYLSLTYDPNVVKISVVGVAMRTNTGVASIMFETLAGENINIKCISTSEIKISVLLEEIHLERALNKLHTAYGLDDKSILENN